MRPVGRAGGLSAKTVANLRAILKLILEYARVRGSLGGADISLRVRGGQTAPVRVLSLFEQRALEQVLLSEPKPIYLGILISLYAGLRIGEVCALQWGDFQFAEGTVRVCKTAIRIQDTRPDAPARTRLLIDRPKTPCSNRVIPLPDFILTYFEAARQADSAYLLTGTVRLMEPRVCLNQYKRVLRQAGLGDYRFHTLRHTFATRCVESGVDLKSLSEIMGHSNVTVTMQRYVHPSLELKRVQMNKLAAVSICGQTSGQATSPDA